MLLTAALLSSLALIQQFSCFPDDPYSNDRAIIALSFSEDAAALPEIGTLFISSGVDSEGDQASTGILKMRRADTKTTVAEETISYSGEDGSSRYKVVLPIAVIGHATKNLPVTIELENIDHTNHGTYEMSCYTNLFERSGTPRGVN